MVTKKCGCTTINEKEWNNKTLDWSGKTFHHMPTILLFHIPIRIGADIKQLFKRVKKRGYKLVKPTRILQKDRLFFGNIMVEIEPVNHKRLHLSTFHGKIKTKVYNGAWKGLGTATKQFVQKIGKENIKEIYFWYLTCPECVKDDGEHKTIMIAHLKNS